MREIQTTITLEKCSKTDVDGGVMRPASGEFQSQLDL